MPQPFPHNYSVGLFWKSGDDSELVSDQRTPIEGGPPPEFDGTDARWSPEHLLLAALAQCFMLTWIALN